MKKVTLDIQNQPMKVTLQIENKFCKGMSFVKSAGIDDCRLIDVRKMSKGITRHLVEIGPKSKNKVDKYLSDSFKILQKEKNQIVAWFDSEGCVVCKTILANNSFLISAKKLEGFSILYSFVVPTTKAFQNILSKLEEAQLPVKIIEISKFSIKSNLTAKQETTLFLAHKLGYFQYPRQITLQQLAERINTSPSNLSEILRRGINRLLKKYFDVDKQ